MARERTEVSGYQKPEKKSFGESLRLIKSFLPYLKPHRVTLFLVLFCTAVNAGCEIYLPLTVRKITNIATDDIGSLTVKFIVGCCLTYAVIKLLESTMSFLETFYGHVMGVQIENKMREDMFDHLQTLSFTFFDNTKVGQLMSRMTSDLFDVAEWAHHFPEMVFTTIIKFVASFFIFARMDLRIALIIFALLPFMIILTKKTRTQMKETFREGRHRVGEINADLEDNLLGIRVVKAFTGEETQRVKFIKGCREYVKIKRRSHKYMATFHSIVRLIDGLMYIAVVGVGAYFMHIGITSTGDFAASLLLVQTLLSSIRSIIDFSEQFSRGTTGLERFLDIMNEKPDIVDSENAVEMKDVRGKIEIRNISFKYETRDRIVLKDFSLTVKPGENVAIVGPSGGGKTTICNLIPRFYTLDSGEILIDDKNITEIKLKSLRQNIGIVQQDVYLFSGTIKDNILYGNPFADDDAIIEATKNAGAYDFIMGLPDGFDTYIGERGVKLSGGQKQRISIARVFLKNPPILLLDEATSALDNENERLVQCSLERLAKGRTVITIAHRLTTIKNADRIVVLTDEGVIEEGSHSELMAKGGAYSKLYELYQS